MMCKVEVSLVVEGDKVFELVIDANDEQWDLWTVQAADEIFTELKEALEENTNPICNWIDFSLIATHHISGKMEWIGVVDEMGWEFNTVLRDWLESTVSLLVNTNR